MENAWTFGKLPDGRKVTAYALTSASGLRAVVLNYGGILQSLTLPDGKNIVLGHETLPPYLSGTHYCGAFVGRNANRIRNATFEIDGLRSDLPANAGEFNLHSGPQGFDVQMWSVTHSSDALILRHVSPDGHQGFPGDVAVMLLISLKDLSLRLDMRATTTAPTPVNPTWHPYFNLKGEGRIDGHDLQVAASHRTVLDAPAPKPVADTRYDFRRALPLGHVRLDDNYTDCEGAVLRAGDQSISVKSSLPDLQVYTGDALDAPRTGIALEPQFRPDDINREQQSLLRPGEIYAHWIEYKFDV